MTDGYPQGCDDADDTIEAVVAEVEAARADGIDTYVIGVANPPIDGRARHRLATCTRSPRPAAPSTRS